MFILSDGKNYVMENPMQQGQYMRTTSPVQAKRFTYKQARSLLQSRSKKLSWIREFQMINEETNEVATTPSNYRGNGGLFIGENNFDFDYEIIDTIGKETNSIIGLAGWSMTQLKTYEEMLLAELSKIDSAESDIKHALEKYKEDNNGKKAQAHKMAKVGYLLDDIRDKHKRIKQGIRCVQVMKSAIEQKYTIERLKLELVKAKSGEYQGRTEYYQMALDILK